MPSKLLDGPLDDPVALAGQPARPAPDQSLAGRRPAEHRRRRGDRGASWRPVDRSTWGPVAPTSRWRSCDAPGREAGRGGSSGWTAGRRSLPRPRRGRSGRRRRPTGSSSTWATAARSPSPTARSTSSTRRSCSITSIRRGRVALIAEMARVARLGIVINDLRPRPAVVDRRVAARPPADRQPVHASRRADVRAARLPAVRGGAMLGPRTWHRSGPSAGFLGHRYAIAAVRVGPRSDRHRRRGHGWPRLSGSRSWSSAAGRRAPPLATRLARSGHDVVLLERVPGVAMAGRRRLQLAGDGGGARRLGLDGDDAPPWSPDRSRRCASRRRPARRSGSPTARKRGGEPAVGFDRSRLDPALLELAGRPARDVRRRLRRDGRRPLAGRLTVRARDATGEVALRADVVGRRRRPPLDRRRGPPASPVGAAVAAARADVPPRRPGGRRRPRRADAAHPRRIRRDRAVPGGRVNVGIVLGSSWHAAVARDGARAVADGIVGGHPARRRRPGDVASRRAARPHRRRVADRPSRHATRRPGLAARGRCRRVPRPVHRGGPASGARLGRAGRGGHRRASRGRAAPSTPTIGR